MRRSFAMFASLFTLSAEGARFFYVTAVAHALMKVGLGLCLVRNDGYGLGSMVAPPGVFVLVGGDVLVCFGVAKLLDHVPYGRRRLTHGVALALLFLFLIASFVVHSYFKAFVNRGLLEFNGASSHELADYTLAALDRFSLPFVAATALIFVGHIALWDAPRLERLALRRDILLLSLAVAGACVGYQGTLSQGQCGFLARNPGYELVRSYAVRGESTVTKRATEAELLAFGTGPGPLFGHYDNALDVRVPSQRGKNVLFVLIESLPLEQTSLGGSTDALPIAAELARDGVAFSNFRTAFPATSRSFLTYHCGVYPTTGLATATKYQPGYACDSIVDRARQHGYRTGFFTAPMFTYDNLHKSAVIRGYDTYADFLKLEPRMKVRDGSAPAVDEETVVDALMEFVDAGKPGPRGGEAAPFFATYFMFWNHAPYRLPHEDISALKPHDRYVRTLAYLDGVLRDVLSKLEERGLRDDTLVVLSADHGEGFGIHHENVNHVGHVYEDDVRVPFLVHVPGLGAHQSARQASNVDFAPTLAGLLGFERAPSWQGQDMLAERFEARPTLVFGRASFATNAIIDGNLKYIEYPSDHRQLLYDLSVDPHEQRNLAGSRAAEAAAYHGLVQRWLPVVEAKAWAAGPQRPDVELARTGS